MSDSNRSTAALKKVREELVLRKQELEEQLTNLSAEQVSDGQVQDAGDQALSSVMESLRASLQDAEIAEYRMLIKAIDMVDKGTYGICEDCSRNISEKRLQLIPNAVRCLICQEEFEESGG